MSTSHAHRGLGYLHQRRRVTPTSALEDDVVALMPGPRRPREIWTGRSELWVAEVPSDPAEPMRNLETRGLRSSSRDSRHVVSRDRRRRKSRIEGIDAARGFALIGMFAIHILPAVSGDHATLTWILLGGNAASLFAVLAGASLSFSSGGQTPATGAKLWQARTSVVVRSALLILIGCTINALDLPVFDILPYFAVMFLFALPLMGRSARTLLPLSAVLLLGLPFLRYLIHGRLEGFGYYPNPQFADLLNDPIGVVATLSISGIYPALTWLGLICLGLGVGRLPLHHSSPRLTLTAVGVLLATIASAISILIVSRFGGYWAVAAALPGYSEAEIDEFIVFGPNGQLPTGSAGWLFANGPHTDTPFTMLTGAGFALAMIGFFVIASRWRRLLRPLIDMGTMSMSIYLMHLLIMDAAPDDSNLTLLFIVQVLAAAAFACLWRVFFTRGPIEWVMWLIAGTGVRALFTSFMGSRRDDDRVVNRLLDPEDVDSHA